MDKIIYVSPNGSDKWSGNYPSPNADLSDGPLATLDGARNAVRVMMSQEGQFNIKVLIKGGRYEQLKTAVFGLDDSGRPDRCVSYQAYQDERPVFCASVAVEGWRKLDCNIDGLSQEAQKNVWVADMPRQVKNFRVLYSGGKPLKRARGKGFNPTVSGHWQDSGCWEKGSRTLLHFPKGMLRQWENIADVEIVIRPWCLWTMNILPLKSVDEANCVAETAIEGSYFLTKERYHRFPPQSVWPENIPEAMTEPGRWFVNTGQRKIYLWPQAGGIPEKITVPCTREIVRVEGIIQDDKPYDIPVRHLSFKGLCFAEGDRDCWTASHKGIQHDWEMWDEGNALLRLRGAEDCEVIGCEFGASGGSGIRLDLHCRNNLIEGNHIHDLGGTGIFLGGYGAGLKDVNNNNTVVNNHIHDCGQLFWHSCGIAVHQSGENRIAHNLLYNLPYSGIVIAGIRPGFLRKQVRKAVLENTPNFDRSFIPIKENMRTQSLREICSHIRWDEVTVIEDVSLTDEMTLSLPFIHSRQNIIEYNEIHDIMQVLGDGNGIYISDCGPYNVLRYNRIYNMTHAFGVGIRTDAWQRDTLVEGNIIHDCRGGLAVSRNNLAWNNVIAFIRSTGLAGKKEGEADREVFSPIYYHLDRAEGFNDGTIQRNICYHTGEYPIKFNLDKIDRQAADGRQIVDWNVIYWDKRQADAENILKELRGFGFDINSISADPCFVNAEARDFRLTEDSPARHIGIKSLPQQKMGLQGRWLEGYKLEHQRMI